jgi:hypothetical protein
MHEIKFILRGNVALIEAIRFNFIINSQHVRTDGLTQYIHS